MRQSQRSAKPLCSARILGNIGLATLRSRNIGEPWAILKMGRSVFMDWRHRAACLDEDPELFFPIGNTGPAILQIEEAKVVCRRCDVREQCLAWALESGQDHGVWGGLSEDERRTLKRRNARARIRALARSCEAGPVSCLDAGFL